MKNALLITLLTLLGTTIARASGPTTIDIKTTDAGVTFYMSGTTEKFGSYKSEAAPLRK